MWIKERISSYRFSKTSSYKNALEKTAKTLQNKFGSNKVFLSDEIDQHGRKHYFIKANLKKEEAKDFKRVYNELTNMFFACKQNRQFNS
ncbi:hypothetical protein [Natroniella sp. ANB-PHB2]|uniref:hypothetical protein n=1 Tax=Natroniella sp. ANB-PHB2 TaxID=3384444 RepID=UPI0038D37FA5